MKNFTAFIEPTSPPSWLAPLSLKSTKSVLSSSPISSSAATRRPRCSSVCSTIPAYAACSRTIAAWSSGA